MVDKIEFQIFTLRGILATLELEQLTEFSGDRSRRIKGLHEKIDALEIELQTREAHREQPSL